MSSPLVDEDAELPAVGRRLSHMGVIDLRSVRATILGVALAFLVACTPSLRPAPSAAPPTPSVACVAAWQATLANPSDPAASDATMRACRSLEEFAAGDEAARSGGKGGIDSKVMAQLACETGRFSDTSICRQLGITPSPGSPATPSA